MLVFGVLGVALALRLGHLSSAVLSPLNYQPGPDEDYYRQFGEAVAAGRGQNGAEFTFMDPAYGYLLGGIFKLAGSNIFFVYLLQVLIDALTAFGILTIGKLLGRPRAGLYGALIYGVSAIGIMFCTTLLKEVWVTGFMTWWVAGALLLIRSERVWRWLLFGVYCGVGIAFRSTQMLMGLFALLLPLLAMRSQPPLRRLAAVALLGTGIAAALLPWSVRNHAADGSFSPLPHNGGIVLQQVYNAANPGSEIWIPAFVNYLHPGEIWRGYAAEASARLGRPLLPQEVDRYWRGEALAFIRQHPEQVFNDVLHKLRNWLAATEIPNNRSYVEEQMFSPVLNWLPAPAAWLLGMGLAGLVWLAIEDRRWPIVAAPVFLSLFTVALFFSESRFRFHATGILALCSGIWIDRLTAAVRGARVGLTVSFVALAGAVSATSLYLGHEDPPATIHWDRIVWGYINMGRIAEGRTIAERILAEHPDEEPLLEALGYTAAARQQYDEAARDFERAVELRPRSHIAHFNLARVFLAQGNLDRAAAEAKTAARLNPSAEYRDLLTRIEKARH
jgi:tetratricopeptide (TPR) repeat protein